MTIEAEQQYAAAQRVYELCTQEPIPTPLRAPTPGFATHLTTLQSTMHGLQTAVNDQRAATRAMRHLTRRGNALRRVLREEWLRPLAAAARVFEAADPGLVIRFRAPSTHARHAQLIAEARAALAEVAKSEFFPKFAAEFGADFLTRFQTAIEAVETHDAAQNLDRDRKINGTARVRAVVTHTRRTMRYLRSVARASCHATMRVDETLGRTTWDRFVSAAHVQRTGRRRITTAPMPTTPTPSAESAVSAG